MKHNLHFRGGNQADQRHLAAALRSAPLPDANQPRGPDLVGQEENEGPAMKTRAIIAYFGTIVAAVAFAVLFIWLGWACLQAYMEWSQKTPPPTSRIND
jgi:fatty acid desaturase